MKMIYDSQQRQEALHESIQDYQKQTSPSPAASALARQQVLKERIKDLENQTVIPTSSQLDDTQLGALEAELEKLEQNYAQLKELLGQMKPKFRRVSMTASQHVEQDKLEGHVNDLTRQEAGLKSDLDDLRSQMVDLDKRKSSLEMLIRQQP
jgi:archaellum component FlaC